jgi:hypothetical protein
VEEFQGEMGMEKIDREPNNVTFIMKEIKIQNSRVLLLYYVCGDR